MTQPPSSESPAVPDRHSEFLATHKRGVLITLRRNGRPQSSNVVYLYDPETAEARVSVTVDRAKTRNAARDPRVSMHVNSTDFWSYLVAEGQAVIGGVATDPNDGATDALVDLYRSLAGEHPNWDEFRAVQVREQRLVMTLQVGRTYGMVQG